MGISLAIDIAFDKRFQDLKRRCEEFEIMKDDNKVPGESRRAISPAFIWSEISSMLDCKAQ